VSDTEQPAKDGCLEQEAAPDVTYDDSRAPTSVFPATRAGNGQIAAIEVCATIASEQLRIDGCFTFGTLL